MKKGNKALLIYLFPFIIYRSYSIIIPLEPNFISEDFTLSKSDHLLKNVSFSLPTMNVCFGSPIPQCFKLVISSYNPFTLIESTANPPFYLTRQYNRTESTTNNRSRSTLVNFPFMYINFFRVIGDSMTDILTIPGISQSYINKPFMFVALRREGNSPKQQNTRFNFEGYIGLNKNCYRLGPYHLSLVNYLFTNKVIPKENYALWYNTDGSGEIHFGESYKHKAMCSSNPTHKWNDWDCLLTELRIGNEVKSELNRTLIFDSAKQYVEVGGEEGWMILEVIVQYYPNKCGLKGNLDYTVLLCEKDIQVDVLPSIHLKLKTADLVLEWKYMMKETPINNEIKLVSLLMFKSDMKANDIWLLGIPAFMNRTIMFDYEIKQMGFVNEVIDQRGELSITLILLCFKIVIMLLSFSLLALCYISKFKLYTHTLKTPQLLYL